MPQHAAARRCFVEATERARDLAMRGLAVLDGDSELALTTATGEVALPESIAGLPAGDDRVSSSGAADGLTPPRTGFGIGPGSTQAQVLEAYGAPTSTLGDRLAAHHVHRDRRVVFTLRAGVVSDWLVYDVD